jgi:hypothetical protein
VRRYPTERLHDPGSNRALCSKRGAAALVAGTHRGSQRWGASSGVAGDGDGRGPDDRTADAPFVAFRRGGSLLPPPVGGDGSNSGDKK